MTASGWVIIKVVFAFGMTVTSVVTNWRCDGGGPYWLDVLPLVMVPMVMLIHIRAVRLRGVTLSAGGMWKRNPFRVIDDPLALYHFIGWISLVAGTVGLCIALMFSHGLDTPIMNLSGGLGAVVMIRVLSHSGQATRAADP